jgi:2,3-bisphosphoglycerate-dependent phosphoglycerate mutase
VVGIVTMELWLVRHGETDWSTTRRFCGWSDPPLNERGRAQALALRPILAGEDFDSVRSSTSARAIETARLAYGEPTADERLRELDFGDMEGMTWDECSPELRDRLATYETFAAPGGETVRDLMARVAAVVDELGDGRHLIVTHGGVIFGVAALAGVTGYPQLGSLTRVALDPEARPLSTGSVRAL